MYDHRTSLFYRSCQRRGRTEMYRDRVQQQAGTGEQLLLSPQTVPKILYKFLLVGEFGQQFVLVLCRFFRQYILFVFLCKLGQLFPQHQQFVVGIVQYVVWQLQGRVGVRKQGRV